ncbi:ATP-grasp domain-containing protein [Microlunatus parietis]|uniref:Glutathione synthase/RimK-type ligase-like ATP-grasp enzyme n=1 Tax=Microlunatus parietis TaxID=682979 RepID=A0A7Y9I6F7_9ACTN|nr:hypothetical protein [Microlunatus parietis]NYE70915.1 glutathione synthase/RimK-type ligase-like ATP-grasp enzyme [Microlunatus parietis]
MIIILAPPADVHARRVSQEITRLGGPVEIVDWRTAGVGAMASLHFAGPRIRRSIRADDARTLDLADAGAVWTRRVGAATVSPAIIDTEQRRFAQAEWRDLLYGLAEGPTAVSPLSSQRAATKPAQLAQAPRAGLIIPETLITSDPADAAAFIDHHAGRVVHKVMNGPADRLLATARWDERHRAELDRLRLTPTIFQELVEGPRDLRVTMIGTECLAVAFDRGRRPGPVDSRLDLDVPVRPYELPAGVQAALARLMAALGLTFATIDLKEGWDGTLYFLELNPQGQFLYVEILTGLPIAAAMGRHLVELDGQAF